MTTDRDPIKMRVRDDGSTHIPGYTEITAAPLDPCVCAGVPSSMVRHPTCGKLTMLGCTLTIDAQKRSTT